MHFKKLDKTSWVVLFGFIAVVFIISAPLWQHPFVYGDDIFYHLGRCQSIADGLLSGQFPVKIHPFLLKGYGYGSGLFYPQFFLYLPAALILMGVNLVAAYKCFLMCIIAAAFCSAYFSGKYILKSRYAALCAAVLYCASKTFLLNLFKREALGESIAMVFMPIIICGLYNLIDQKFSKPWILILGFWGLMLSHTISLAIALIIAFIMVLVHFKIFISNGKPNVLLIKKLMISSGIVLALSAFFWIPMLEQMISSSFQVSASTGHVGDRSITLWGLLNPMVDSGIGLLLMAFLLLRIFCKPPKIVDRFLIWGAVLSLCATYLFPWHLFDHTPLNNIQFPWRLLSFATAFFVLGIAGLIAQFQKRWQKFLLLGLMCLAAILTSVHYFYQLIPESFYQNSAPTDIQVYSEDESIGWGEEWLPLDTDTSLLNDPQTVVGEGGVCLNVTQERDDSVSFVYDAKEDCAYFDVPLLYYKGYHAKLVCGNESFDLPVVCSPNNNLVRVENNQNQSGKITVCYTGTLWQTLSYWISALTALLIVAIWIYRREKRTNQLPRDLADS